MSSINTQFMDIVTRLTACNGVAIDDHMEHAPKLFDQLMIIKGVALTKEFHVPVAVDPNTSYSTYSLNRLYVGADGMVHVSRAQVGCVINGDLEAAVTDVIVIAK